MARALKIRALRNIALLIFLKSMKPWTYLSDQEIEDHEYIPLITPEDEEKMDNEHTPEVLSLLPLRNTVLFPGVVIPITVGRDKSIRLVQEANKGNKVIVDHNQLVWVHLGHVDFDSKSPWLSQRAMMVGHRER